MATGIVTMDLHSHVIEKKVKSKDYWQNAKQKKIDVMAITEHAHFNVQSAFDRVQKEKPKGKILVPGVELNTTIGHVLCYAPDERVYDCKELFELELPIETALDYARDHGFLLSCAHPWGYNADSAAFLIGPKKLARLLTQKELGIEAYNGMVGHLSDILYESGWVRRPNNFLDFLQKNRVSRKIGIGHVGEKVKKSFDRMAYSYLNRITASVELGEKAAFITAGSDAHRAERIGEGMLKVRAHNEIKSAQDVLELIQKKEDVVWCGVGVKEISRGVYEKMSLQKIKRIELIDGVKYMAMRRLRERVIQERKRKEQMRREKK